MNATTLSFDDKRTLLSLARESIRLYIMSSKYLDLDPGTYSPALRGDGASFVTLTKSGALRGCIGALQAYQPLVQDVCEHAVAAATSDYRFPPVREDELELLSIEISRLTPPTTVHYHDPEKIIQLVRPHVDGVIIQQGRLRATFLPQVWEKLPDPVEFISRLCQKMGVDRSYWQRELLDLSIYQVEEFSEETFRE